MKVLLVVPTFHYPQTIPLSFSDFPTAWGYLAAALKEAGHEVVGLNPNNLKGYPSQKIMLQDQLTRKILAEKPGLIGLGGLATDYEFLRDAISIIRHLNQTIPIVLGGQIVTNDADWINHHLKPNFSIKGEAEATLVDLVDALEHKRFAPAVLDPIVNDIDSIPFPDYSPFNIEDMLDHHSQDTRLLYRYPRTNPRPFTIVASRGCPFSCTFCIHGHRDTPYRARSIPNIMEELRVTYDKYHFNILIILDELFAVNKERMKEFCDGVLDGKAKYGWDFDWMFQTHASAKLDLEALQLAKRAGCFFFSYGLESASPTVLKSMNKKITPEQVVEAIKLAHEANVAFGANLIFGDPAETEETWAESLAFWLRHGQDCFMFLSTIVPYPGSQIFDYCMEKGIIRDKKHYYENINGGAYNMTAMPNYRFDSLLKLTHQLGGNDWMFPRLAKDVTTEHSPSMIVYTCSTDRLKDLEAEGGIPIDWNILKVPQGVNVRVEPSHGVSIIHATCPYCNHRNTYQEVIPDPTKPFMLGTACLNCHKRIRIDTGEPTWPLR